jgi:glutamine amidotransferase
MSASPPEIRVSVFDYGAGNLHSLVKALAAPNVRERVESDTLRAVDRRAADLLLLPGVGAFAPAVARLAIARQTIRAAVEDALPVVGICLGMQLFFESSDEGPGVGLGIIPGHVRRLRALRVPQIGWNTIDYVARGGGIEEMLTLDMAYFANSYVCVPADDRCVLSWTTYENDRFASFVRAGPLGNVVGVQFHPEKSSALGVRFLQMLIARAAEQAVP